MSYNLQLILRWGPRSESREACAEKLATFLSHLISIDDLFASWYRPGKSLKVAQNNRVHPLLEELQPLFKPMRNDLREIVSDLGFGSVRLWNGKNENKLEAGLGLSCGKTSSIIPNTFHLSFPSNEEAERRLIDKAVEIMSLAITTWSPDTGSVLKHAWWWDLFPPSQGNGPELGWLTFLSNSYGTIPELPSPTRVIPIEGFGTIIRLTEEPATALQPQHIAQAQLVRNILANSGISVRAPEYEPQKHNLPNN